MDFACGGQSDAHKQAQVEHWFVAAFYEKPQGSPRNILLDGFLYS